MTKHSCNCWQHMWSHLKQAPLRASTQTELVVPNVKYLNKRWFHQQALSPEACGQGQNHCLQAVLSVPKAANSSTVRLASAAVCATDLVARTCNTYRARDWQSGWVQ